MKYQVTDIEFDFDDPDEEFTQHHFDKITDQTIGQIWDADDEDDLVEEITCATGWCIKSIDYRIIKKLPFYANWIMNRSELQTALIQQMLDDMDLKTMPQLCYDYLEEGYDKYSEEELITECEEYYPELLEG